MEQVVSVHPLRDCLEQYSRTWSEWKNEWASARTYDHKHILIRRGFYMEASDDEGVERLLLYFKMADGHRTGEGLDCKPNPFWREEEPYPVESEPRTGGKWTADELKRALAHQAYQELVYHFFRSREDHFHHSDTFTYPWLKWLKHREVMAALLHFFRLKDGELPNYDQRDDESKKKRASVEEALVDICGARWQIGIPCIASDWSGVPLVENADKFLEILFGLGRLDIFQKPMSNKGKYERKVGAEGITYVPDFYQLMPLELAKLRELALSELTIKTGRTEYSGGVTRHVMRGPKSIEEAITRTDSQAASVYVTICSRQNVDWRP